VAEPWDAERVVGVEEARRLIRERFPEVAARDVELLGEGFDNIVYRVDGRWSFRFPRRSFGADVVAHEVALLRRLAGRLPLTVPAPRFVAEPGDGFPWPFAGYDFLAGRTACRAGLDDTQRRALAAPLGAFLGALHALPVPDGTPGDTIGRLDLAKRVPQVRALLDELAARGAIDPADARALRAIAGGAGDGPRARCVVHGDLYVRHLIVDAAGRLTGVIDWGDAHRGDPAADLMIVAALLPHDAREDFRAAYGPIDDATWRLARFRALNHTLLCLRYALATADPHLTQESLKGIASGLL
jgi:aminoglycoside phosphotransferase (APT) family kinase protein